MRQVSRFTSMAIILIALLNWTTTGQVSSYDSPPSLKYRVDLSEVASVQVPNVNYQAQKSYNGKEGSPLWAGFSVNTNIKPQNSGTIIKWESGYKSWIVKISYQGAPALGLVLSDLKIPSDAFLHVYSEDDPNRLYSISGQGLISQYISTPPLLAETIVIEYIEKTMGSSELMGTFSISELVVIKNGLGQLYSSLDLGGSESCHVNINCSPEGESWQNQKRGISRILLKSGTSWYWCTGSLVNNTNQDGKPYFLTAEHCGGNASAEDRSVWQFYFNYEREGCTSTDTPPNNVITGCTLRAIGPLSGGSDFQLLELSSTPPLSWRTYYNGWDRNTTGSTGGVSIHHPSGDAKKISTYTTTLTSTTPNIGGSQMAANSAWRVTWSATANGHGVTEGGSSGSPIFSSTGLLVGTLSGGSSSCTNLNGADFYGKFNFHWSSNGSTNDKKLQPWLDPNATDIQFLQGFDPNGDLYPNFVANKTYALVGDQISFSDLSSGTGITTWSWNFGEDGQPSTANGHGPHNVSFTQPGPKTISLTINESETVVKTDYVNIIEVPENTILYEIFEDDYFPPNGWLNLDKDGDSYKWFSYTIADAAYSGVKSAASASWIQSVGPVTPDNWLITPPIEVTHDDFFLSYYVGAQDPSWPKEKYGVFISNKRPKFTDFDEIFVETFENAQWHHRQISLSNYLGDIIYIAFRHFDCTDWFYLKLDDVLITGGGDGPSNQARIHKFDFEEGGVVKNIISGVENNQASITVKVVEGTQFNSLTPTITISQGASINYVWPTTMDFTSPVNFEVTSESGTTINTYTVTLEYAEKYPVSFIIKDSGQNPVQGAIIQVEGETNSVTTDEQGVVTIDLVDGVYSFTVNADGFQVFTGSFEVDENPLDVNVRLTLTSLPANMLQGLKAFPNPFNDVVRINNTELIKRVVFTNIVGQVVLDVNITDTIIITSSLPRGIYLVTFIGKNGERIVRKMIKQ